LPAWIARLTGAGVAPVLAQAIGPVEAAVLLRAAQLSVDAPPRSRTIQSASLEPPQLGSAAQDVERAGAAPRREFGPAFAALPSWLQTLARAGGVAPPASSMMPIAPAAHAVPAADAVSVAHAARAVHTTLAVRAARTAPVPAAFAAPDTRAKAAHESILLERADADIARLPGHPESITTEAAPEPSPGGDRPFLNAAASACGGLLFLVPVLQRLGYDAWAGTLPESAAAHVAQQLLASVLRRLDAPPDDPAWLLASTPSNYDFGYIDLKAPASWGDPTLAAPRGAAAKDIVALAEQAQSAAALAHVWLIACRRWLRRVAGIGVASLVMRPAAIGLTATHADVFFRLEDADMSVRRAGLDFDPGWLPWYGRVISFHYAEQLISVPAPRAGGVSDGG
jgi:hypothetical protein